MGTSFYSMDDRSSRSISMDYASVHTNAAKVFTQNTLRQIHESMEPKNALLRESCDSESHPEVVPIFMGMDETGSMGTLPAFLVTEGFPKIMSKLLERGVDPALLFAAIGDHESDQAPFQVGQFESGDAELDMWLTRSWLEGNGGGNGGESYLLAYYYAAFHIKTDAWDKRGKKGFLFTIGDEPTLRVLPSRAIKEIFGINVEKNYGVEELIELASEKFHIFHINITHNHQGRTAGEGWKKLLGEGLIETDSASNVADIIVDKISKMVESERNEPTKTVQAEVKKPSSTPGTSSAQKEEVML